MIDWTDFDADGHSTVCIYAITRHGRATPLVWSTVEKAKHKGWRKIHEDTYYRALPAMKAERLEPLITAFSELVRSHIVFRKAFGLL